jgi:hypothetical protein
VIFTDETGKRKLGILIWRGHRFTLLCLYGSICQSGSGDRPDSRLIGGGHSLWKEVALQTVLFLVRVCCIVLPNSVLPTSWVALVG